MTLPAVGAVRTEKGACLHSCGAGPLDQWFFFCCFCARTYGDSQHAVHLSTVRFHSRRTIEPNIIQAVDSKWDTPSFDEAALQKMTVNWICSLLDLQFSR